MQKTLSQIRVEKDYYTTKQISEIYHISQASVCSWCRKGWLQADREKNPNSLDVVASGVFFPNSLKIWSNVAMN